EEIELFTSPVPTLADAPGRFSAALQQSATVRTKLLSAFPRNGDALAQVGLLSDAISQSTPDIEALSRRLLEIADAAEKMFFAMDFEFLFDTTRKLFSIGYRATDGTLETNCYDLLASEARLTSFIAIAKEDVPTTHWFRLGRSLTPVGRGS